MGVRFGANVERSLGTVKHYVGLPPRLTGGRDTRSLMPTADVVLIAEEGGAFYVYRYVGGSLVGDTWHQTVEDARQQVEFEFTLCGSWVEVPPDEPEPAGYVRARK